MPHNQRRHCWSTVFSKFCERPISQAGWGGQLSLKPTNCILGGAKTPWLPPCGGLELGTVAPLPRCYFSGSKRQLCRMLFKLFEQNNKEKGPPSFYCQLSNFSEVSALTLSNYDICIHKGSDEKCRHKICCSHNSHWVVIMCVRQGTIRQLADLSSKWPAENPSICIN